MKELILGSGYLKQKVLFFLDGGKKYQNPVKVDIDPNCGPDYIWDLNKLPYPFADEEFDEIHAYEILEHLGTQGDWKFFFDQFKELHRILKEGGSIFISVPDGKSHLTWCDPGHTRALPIYVFGFLSQKNYEDQIGKTSIADYRHYWKKNFDILQYEEKEGRLYIVLRKNQYSKNTKGVSNVSTL